MVSEARARVGGSVLRQWVVGWRGGCTVHHFADLSALGMARRVRDSGFAGIFVADCVAQDVLPAAGTSANYTRRATDATDGYRGGIYRQGRAGNAGVAAMGRLAEVAADVGNARCEGADRSDL